MLISHRYKFVTIDIPKTGTRSYRDTLKHILCELDEYGDHGMLIARDGHSDPFTQHGSVEQAKHGFIQNDWQWDQYQTFTVVRDPWARYYSCFNYLKQQSMKVDHSDWKSFPEPVKRQATAAKSLFTRFKNDREVFKHVIKSHPAQHEYYTIDNEPIVHNIHVFENLQHAFDDLCYKCGFEPIELYHSNLGTYKESHTDFYDQETIDMVAEKEKFTIQLKQYEYNS